MSALRQEAMICWWRTCKSKAEGRLECSLTNPKDQNDTAYFQRRAEEEIEAAKRSVDPNVVALHHRLAELYLERVAQMPPESRSDQ